MFRARPVLAWYPPLAARRGGGWWDQSCVALFRQMTRFERRGNDAARGQIDGSSCVGAAPAAGTRARPPALPRSTHPAWGRLGRGGHRRSWVTGTAVPRPACSSGRGRQGADLELLCRRSRTSSQACRFVSPDARSSALARFTHGRAPKRSKVSSAGLSWTRASDMAWRRRRRSPQASRPFNGCVGFCRIGSSGGHPHPSISNPVVETGA